jgi:hypothetical protein
MDLRTAALAITAATALLLGGCEPKVLSYKLKVVTAACVAPPPLEGATHLRFWVTGEGLAAPLEVVSEVTGSSVEIPEIPAGRGRMVEVRAYAGEPALGGRVVAVGKTLPFEVPQELPKDATGPLELTVFLRRVNAFSPPSLVLSPTTCSRMVTARAGHTATLLPDGRVFIGGGFKFGSSTAIRESLADAEIYNPATGAFEQAPPLGIVNNQQFFQPTPRAFHGATLADNGKVVLVGGESQNATGQRFVVASGLAYDDRTRSYEAFQLQGARIRPGVARGTGGRVLIVGGWYSGGSLMDKLEWLDPDTLETHLMPSTLRRAGMVVAPVQGGDFIAVAGGSDGTRLSDEVIYFGFDLSQNTFTPSTATARLRQARHGAAAANFAGADRLVLVGGYREVGEPSAPLATSEILNTGAAFSVADGPPVVARGDSCAAALGDGRVLAVGGRTGDGAGGSISDRTVELITPTLAGTATALGLEPLAAGRYFHTCTTLTDGSVLVVGGVREQNGVAEVLGDAAIFTPAPLD